MCGIFAYKGTNPDRGNLERVIRAAALRGPDSYGYAIGDQFGLSMERGYGDLRVGWPGMLEMLDSRYRLRFILGHSRLATSGVFLRDLNDTMPLHQKDVVICHNGNVREHKEVAKRRNYSLRTSCDSEVIVHLMAEEKGSLGDRLEWAASVIWDGLPFVIVAADREGNLAAIRNGLPLFEIRSSDGVYLCSRDPNFGEAVLIEEALIREFPVDVERARQTGVTRSG